MSGNAYYTIEHRKDNNFVYSTSVNYYENISIDETLEGKNYKNTGTKTYNEIKYGVYEKKNQTNDNIILFAYQYGKNTYTIMFVSKYDTSALIEIFMNNISYK